ncbi:MAG: alpha/beta hydrolase, partial [Acidobacteriota bacterium]
PRSTMHRMMLRSCLALAIGLLASTAAAADCPALQVRHPQGNYIVPGVKGDIPYSGDLALDAYVQRDGTSRPSVVVIHGGEWTSGSRTAHVGQLLELVTGAGYNWFSVDYRLAGLAGIDASLDDLRSAVAFIRCHARDFGIDGRRLVLLGEDSGAHLAALLATERPAGVVGAILIGGYYDLSHVAAAAADPALLARATPQVRPAMMPILVVHGGDDTEAPPETAVGYCDLVSGAGGQCRYVEVRGASHRSENWYPSQWHYKQEIAAWLAATSGVPLRAVRPPAAGPLRKNILYNPSTGLRLDAFAPPKAAAPVPAVIVVHGGGWEAGDKVTYVTPIFAPLATAGLAWFSIDYRLTPAATNADQLEDLRRAIAFVRAQHARYNIDPARIFLLGESASGQMVAQIAAEDSGLAGVVSFYGIYDFEAMVTDASPRSLLARLFRRTVLDDAARAVMRRYSPLHQAHVGMPPLLLVNGTGERLWAQAQAYAARLQELGINHEVIAIDGAPHGMENWEGHPEWMLYKERVTDWILRVARRPGV